MECKGANIIKTWEVSAAARKAGNYARARPSSGKVGKAEGKSGTDRGLVRLTGRLERETLLGKTRWEQEDRGNKGGDRSTPNPPPPTEGKRVFLPYREKIVNSITHKSEEASATFNRSVALKYSTRNECMYVRAYLFMRSKTSILRPLVSFRFIFYTYIYNIYSVRKVRILH